MVHLGIYSHSFIHLWHAPPDVDIILQSGRFWATSIASFRERFNDSSTGVSQWSPPLLQRAKLLKSAWHLIRLAFAQCSQTGRDAMPNDVETNKVNEW